MNEICYYRLEEIYIANFLKKFKKNWKNVLTFFDNGVKIITVPSNRQKY